MRNYLSKTSFLIALFLLPLLAVAQRPYVQVIFGYNFGIAKDEAGTEVKATSTKNIFATYGQGIPVGLDAGYMFMKYVGAEAGIRYLVGSRQRIAEVSIPGDQEYKSVTFSRLLTVDLSAVVTSGGDGLRLYGKGGFVIPVLTKLVNETTNIQDVNANQVADTVLTTTETKFQVGIGFKGTMGVSFPVGKKVKLFAELEAVNLRIKTRSATLTESSINGADQLPLLETIDKETLYFDALPADANSDPASANAIDNQPLEALTRSHNFSSLGIHVGVNISF